MNTQTPSHRGQTGPKSIAGKNRSRWNALKDGVTAKSSVLPFEDELLYKRHIREVEKALNPRNYVEAQLVREYAEGLWRIRRYENRSAYERERILGRITPAMIAEMLNLPQQYISCAPSYLTNLRHKISKADSARASKLLSSYRHLQKNAKGIPNLQMVWGQYQELFVVFGEWMQSTDPNATPFINTMGSGINLLWQRNADGAFKLLERFANEIFFMVHFEAYKPTIRVWMESWFFLQRAEMRTLEYQEQNLLKERNSLHNILDRLTRIRKSNLYTESVPAGLSIHAPGK